MHISDFLTILGLAIAVWAIIPNKERRFILLFFSNFELICLVVSVLYIHFLMSFDWLISNWWPALSVITSEIGLPSKTWAYIIALITIIYPIVKVNFCYFSRSRLQNMISLYE